MCTTVEAEKPEPRCIPSICCNYALPAAGLQKIHVSMLSLQPIYRREKKAMAQQKC